MKMLIWHKAVDLNNLIRRCMIGLICWFGIGHEITSERAGHEKPRTLTASSYATPDHFELLRNWIVCPNPQEVRLIRTTKKARCIHDEQRAARSFGGICETDLRL